MGRSLGGMKSVTLQNCPDRQCCARVWVVGGKETGWLAWLGQDTWEWPERAPLTSQHTGHVTEYVGGDREVGKGRESRGRCSQLLGQTTSQPWLRTRRAKFLGLKLYSATMAGRVQPNVTQSPSSTIMGLGGERQRCATVHAGNGRVQLNKQKQMNFKNNYPDTNYRIFSTP